MRPVSKEKRLAAAIVGITVIFCGFFLFCGIGTASEESKKKIEHQKAYSLFTKNCLSCHASVADPEREGRTRDEWHLVINVMHGYGLDLTPEESGLIIDLLYDLRKGMEKEAG